MGQSYRQVGRALGVSASTVGHWVKRAGSERLERMDWSEGSRRPHRLARQLAPALFTEVLRARKWLQNEDPLGEYGAAAIRRYLRQQGGDAPSERTIARWVAQCVPKTVRSRRPVPPRGWYLPAVASGAAELDAVDVVEGLRMQGHGRIEVLNCLSLWESLPGSWCAGSITSLEVRRSLTRHWRKHGRAHYVQFDNDTIFSGAHAQRNYFGRLVHWCLCMDVIPVFAPPLEVGFQAIIEAYNRRWQERVWQRWRHPNLRSLRGRSDAFVQAYQQRKRRDQKVRRGPVKPAREPVNSKLILLRRLEEDGNLRVCAQTLHVAHSWGHKLVRCEVDVADQCISFFRLSRRDPHYQTPLAKQPIKVKLVPWWKPPD